MIENPNPELHEKYTFYLRDYNPVNKTETHMATYAQTITSNALNLSIEQLQQKLQDEYDRYTSNNRRHGTGGFTPMRGTTKLVGRGNLVCREFGYLARGRKIETFCIKENYFKDSERNYELATVEQAGTYNKEAWEKK